MIRALRPATESRWQTLCKSFGEEATRNCGVSMAHSVTHFVSEIFSSANHLEYLGVLEIVSFLIAMALIISAFGALAILILLYVL